MTNKVQFEIRPINIIAELGLPKGTYPINILYGTAVDMIKKITIPGIMLNISKKACEEDSKNFKRFIHIGRSTIRIKKHDMSLFSITHQIRVLEGAQC